MKRIELTQGQFAIVDDADYLWLQHFSWRAKWHSGSKWFYAATNVSIPKNKRVGKTRQKTVFMHRVIANTPDGMVTDHKNHDTLDNRRRNLRVCSAMENTWNMKSANSKSSIGVRGVSKAYTGGSFRAIITVKGKVKYLGSFPTIQLASAAYQKANRKYFGEFGGFSGIPKGRKGA